MPSNTTSTGYSPKEFTKIIRCQFKQGTLIKSQTLIVAFGDSRS